MAKYDHSAAKRKAIVTKATNGALELVHSSGRIRLWKTKSESGEQFHISNGTMVAFGHLPSLAIAREVFKSMANGGINV